MSVCRSCGAENPDTNKYCGACGSALDATEVLRREIDASVDRALAARVKDRAVVETQLANAVLEKLIGWAKTYGTILAVLIALAAFILARLGIDSYQSLKTKVDETSKTVEPKLAAARAAALKAEKDTNELQAELVKRRAQLDAIPQVVERLTALEKVTFENSPGVGADVTKFLQSSLDGFARYLDGIGFVKRNAVSVFVDATTTPYNAFFDPEAKRIIVGKQIARDPDAIYSVFAQYALGEGAGLGDQSSARGALVAGLTDYYPCSYRNDPKFGSIAAPLLGKKAGEGLRNLANQRRFPPVGQEMELHDLEETWGGAFWEMRGKTGQAVTDRLLLRAWQRAPSGGGYTPFGAAILAADQAEYGGAHVAVIRDVFARRGVRLP